jgi:hypothetical protein
MLSAAFAGRWLVHPAFYEITPTGAKVLCQVGESITVDQCSRKSYATMNKIAVLLHDLPFIIIVNVHVFTPFLILWFVGLDCFYCPVVGLHISATTEQPPANI